MMLNMLNKFFIAVTLIGSIYLSHAAPKKDPSTQQQQEKNPNDKIKSLIPHTELETTAKYILLADYHSGQVLYEKNADEKLYPASLTKIVTAMLMFDALAKGRVKPDTKFHISEAAWRLGGSKMFIEVNTFVKAIDLVRGVIIQSGNDASLAIAEGLSGSEENFAKEMNIVCKKLGAQNSNFVNPHGLPNENHYSTARDLWLIARHIIESKYYSIFKEDGFTYSKIKQRNRNPLLGTDIGCDGLKTGYTKDSGYSFVASADNGGQRLVLIISGCDSVKSREKESLKLFKWGFKSFGHYHLFLKGDLVTQTNVWMGQKDNVAVVIDSDVAIVLPRNARRNLKVVAHYKSNIRAPIKKGQNVGYVEVFAPSLENSLRFQLIAATSVAKAGFMKQLKSSISYLTIGRFEDMVEELEDSIKVPELEKLYLKAQSQTPKQRWRKT